MTEENTCQIIRKSTHTNTYSNDDSVKVFIRNGDISKFEYIHIWFSEHFAHHSRMVGNLYCRRFLELNLNYRYCYIVSNKKLKYTVYNRSTRYYFEFKRKGGRIEIIIYNTRLSLEYYCLYL